MQPQPEKDKSVTVTQVSAFVLNQMGDVTIMGLGDDGKMYHWNYQRGAWLQNWETNEQRKLREKAAKKTGRK